MPDPRFGMDAPVQTTTTKTPSGLTHTVSESRTATMAAPQDPITLSTLVQQVTLNGKAYTSTYDSVAKTITLKTPVGRRTVLTLDASGRVVQVQPPGVSAVTVHYDLRGRVDSTTQGTRSYAYAFDTLGRVQSITDPLHSSTLGYDAANRITSALLPDGNSLLSSWDRSSNLASLTPPGKTAHGFSYQAGDLESDYTPLAVDASGTGHVHTDYDLDRQLSRQAADGIATATVPTYDAVKGRLTSVAFSGGTNSFVYDATSGRLSSIGTADGTTLSYAYDGPLLTTTTTWAGPVAGSVSRIYDADFRLATESAAGGSAVTFQYDNDALLTSAGALSITRDPATGFVTGATLGSTTETRTYNAFGEEQSYTAKFNATTLYSADYGTRDGLGRIVTKTETIQGETHTFTYTYDSRNRLSGISKDGVAISHYDYDPNGNRTTAPGLVASPVYDAQDRLTSYAGCSYAYKPDGSLQTKTCSTGTTSYDYDAFGNLRHVGLPSGTAIDYVIDGQNRRIGKKVNGVLVEGFLYRTQLQPAAWLNGDGTVRARFVYAGKPNVPEYMVTAAGAIYRLVTDQVGSVRLVVDTSSGAVIERIDWDEFGNVVNDTASGTQPFGFAGGLRDLDTGLTRFGARDYDPVTGRWTVKDPKGLEGGANLYEYGANEPINNIDPSGDDWLDWDLQPYADFFAGYADIMTGIPFTSISVTGLIRKLDGTDTVVNQCSNEYLAGMITGVVYQTILNEEGFRRGHEIKLKFGNRKFRFAPWGNRGPGREDRPHYHRNQPDPMRPGESVDGQGIGRHRPWDTKSGDNGFWDRF